MPNAGHHRAARGNDSAPAPRSLKSAGLPQPGPLSEVVYSNAVPQADSRSVSARRRLWRPSTSILSPLVKLAIALADAARNDAQGTVAALGLGITRLNIEKIPGQFHGALVVFATPEEGYKRYDFSLTIEAPGQAPQQFAMGSFRTEGPFEQVVMSHTFDMLLATSGTFVFRIECHGGSAEVRFTVTEGTPSSTAKAPVGAGV